MTDTQRIALTFDDGPARWTEPILATLQAHRAHATFFLIGSTAEQQPDLVRRIAGEGHEIGNHSWSHPALARECDDERVRDELQRTNDVLASILGAQPTRFRAPYYDVDERVKAVAAALGLTHTHGDILPPDWHPGTKAAMIGALVLQQVESGMIVGLHDGIPPATSPTGGTRQATADAIASIVPHLVDRGFELVPASELLSAGS